MDIDSKTRAEAEISKKAAEVSVAAARDAAKNEYNTIESRADEALLKNETMMENTKKNLADKAEEMKEKAEGLMGGLKEKTADLLDKGAAKASELADKLGKK